MNLQTFLDKLNDCPESIEFAETMETIETNYTFIESRFTNGATVNEAGQNSGSCKLFAFAMLNKLTKEQTLACFGRYYRVDVLENPDADDHQNIRNFMKYGWDGIAFDREALVSK